MSPFGRLSRLSKVAAATAASGGSLYLFRDQIKPYVGNFSNNKQAEREKELTNNNVNKSIHIDDLPDHVPYLLVGGGTASHSAMRSIRGQDPKAKVLIIGSEKYVPYMRPALSKELWFTDLELRKDLNFKWWNGKEKSIFYEIDEFFLPLNQLMSRETGGVAMIRNMRLTKLDPDNRVAHLENGQTIKYDKCLLAPGGKPKTMPQLENTNEEIKERVLYFRTADDFLKLEKISGSAKRILIIGGGFLGSELTCALVNNSPGETIQQTIYQIYPESGNLGKILPSYLSEFVSKKLENEGANLIPNVEVDRVSMLEDKSVRVELSNGDFLDVDYIVCAVGLEPDVELAKSSGLEIDEKTGGYLVNSELEARTNVWVAGDASCFYDIKLGRRRVEHHDHAVNSGKLAGLNMIGAGKTYSHQSMFWSDLGKDISFEAVGIIDSSLKTVAVFAEPSELSKDSVAEQNLKMKVGSVGQEESRKSNDPSKSIEKSSDGDKYGKGVIFYLKDDIIVGILLWNLFTRLTVARRILIEQKRYDDFNEVAKLFNIYLDD